MAEIRSQILSPASIVYRKVQLRLLSLSLLPLQASADMLMHKTHELFGIFRVSIRCAKKRD